MQSRTNSRKRHGGLAWNAKSNLGLDNAGEWTFEKDRWIWRLAIHHHCPGPTGIGLTLGSFDVPNGASLFIWNHDRTQFLGSFTQANEKDWGFFAIGLLDDDQIVVEYQEPLAVHGQGDVSISQIVDTEACCSTHKAQRPTKRTWAPSAILVLATSTSIVPKVLRGERRRNRSRSSPTVDSRSAQEPWSTTPLKTVLPIS